MRTISRRGSAAALAALLFFGSAAASATTTRGTPERLQRAADIRAARTGKVASKVELVSTQAEPTLRGVMYGDGAAFTKFSQMVFLADGNPRQWQALAEPIAQAFPNAQVTKGDISIAATRRVGNLTAVHVDNTARLPLPTGSADLIAMRRGVCQCHGATLCGGMKPTVPAIRRFVREVYRVLDKNNPNAVAILHGSYGPAQRVEVFRQAADQLQAQDPTLRIELVSAGSRFDAIKVTRRTGAESERTN